MTDVLFSFDTEDFTSAPAAEAILREAEILRAEGVRAGFCVVGYLAEQLKNWGRDDVIEALGHHDLLTHTLGHSVHPTLNEYTDVADFDVAYERMRAQEDRAIGMLQSTFKNAKILGACPPGNQKSYVGMYGYADMGLPIYADTFCDTADGEGVFYCNIYHMQYTRGMDRLLMQATEQDLDALLDRLAAYRRVILYAHPNMAMFTEFWDAINYYKENKCAFGEWKEAPKRTAEESERFYENLRTLIRKIKRDARFSITCYSAVADALAAEPARVITREHLQGIRASMQVGLAPIRTPVSFSVADVFLACRDLLCGAHSHTCGRTYGFLEAPYAIDREVVVTAREIVDAANAMDVSRFLPTRILVGAHTLGPADWLRGALDVLCGEKTVCVTPGAALPSLDVLPQLKDLRLTGWVQSDDFEDRYLSNRLRLQSWTMRFLTAHKDGAL